MFQYVAFKRKNEPDILYVSDGLEGIHDQKTNTFNFLNENNVKFLLTPTPCTEDTKLLLMISSAFDNIAARTRWRQVMSELGEPGVRAVFLISSCDKCTHDLVQEHADHADIVHTTLADGHRRQGYKILSGYIWTYQHCDQVEHVVKTDDNVVMDMSQLMTLSQSKLPENTIVCGSGTPHRNMKTLR